MNSLKNISLLAMIAVTTFLAASCTEADIAAGSIEVAADNFEVERRIVFYNGITNEYILEVEGLCTLGNFDAERELSVTCKTGDDEYKKHFLGLSDNVTYFAEQTEASEVFGSGYYYKVRFRPETITPDNNLDVEE